MRRDPTPFALPELAQSVTSLPGVGPATAAALARREIRTWGDLLFFFPLRYEDRRRPTPIAELAAGERVVAAGTIAQAGTWGRQGRGYRMILRDGTGELPLLWFRPMKGRLGEFQKGEQVLAVGAVEDNREGGLMMAHPSLYRAEEAEGHPALGRVVPIYPALEGAPAGRVQRFMADLVERVAPALPDPLAGVLPRELYPLAASQALTQAHLPPEPPAEDPPWRQALAVGELFYYELGLMLRRRQRRQAPGRALAPPGRLIGRLLQSLPFKLTQGQVEAVEAIRSDLARDWPMGRLLAGDVGTGKTVVAAAAACLAAEAGVQTALMAPTEVLARQHHATLSGLLEPLGLAVALAIGGQNGPQRQAAREAAGRAQVVVGTHALIAEGMEFRDLGLAIIDEQHRFGVEQRLSLAGKGAEPHLLVLSATPIPRTLALALAGHLEISDLPERPGARPPVATEVVAFEERRLALEAMDQALARGEQVYVICSLVEASQTVDAQDAESTFRRLQDYFPEASVGLLHGRMASAEQQEVLGRFATGEVGVLVATTVVEVGVDVPGATLMVVLAAERFGLSQLHQLRGRVGRGERPGRCLLVTGPSPGELAERRLAVLAGTSDGRAIAEADLSLRGPGEALGASQSGLPPFRVAQWSRDAGLVGPIRDIISGWLAADPGLESVDLAPLGRECLRRWGRRLGLVEAG